MARPAGCPQHAELEALGEQVGIVIDRVNA